MTPTPLVISHRTNMGTLPENTIAGAEAAIRDRVDGIEMDVRSTQDGELVLLHDANLDRTTDGHDALAEVTLEQLRSVRVQPLHAYQRSEPVPTLREMLATVDRRAILVLELKESGLEDRVALLLDDAMPRPGAGCGRSCRPCARRCVPPLRRRRCRYSGAAVRPSSTVAIQSS